MNMEKWINNHPDVKEFGATRFAYTRTNCTEYIMVESQNKIKKRGLTNQNLHDTIITQANNLNKQGGN